MPGESLPPLPGAVRFGVTMEASLVSAGRVSVRHVAGLGAIAMLGACADLSTPIAPIVTTPTVDSAAINASRMSDDIRRAFRRFARPPTVRPELVKLGEALAFDPLLSGNRNISCMSCHVPSLATTDARSLSIGQGGVGLGASRQPAPGVPFIGRNSPSLFNLFGRRKFFFDGKVEQISTLIKTPSGGKVTADMVKTFEFGALSAVSMFPVLDRFEMRGFGEENELASIPDSNETASWAALMRRLGAIPEYRTMFEAAYKGTPFDSMTFAHASNAIAGYLLERFSFDNAPLDRFFDNEVNALTPAQLAGGSTFVQRGCIFCHSGALLTDELMRATALPQVGPGKGVAPNPLDDYGRYNVTLQEGDRYRFRTPSLRQVELTAPYGHAGQFATLGTFIHHYNDARAQLDQYTPGALEPALRSTLVNNFSALKDVVDPFLFGLKLDEKAEAEILSFFSALTDPAARNLAGIVPARVPSGLPVEKP